MVNNIMWSWYYLKALHAINVTAVTTAGAWGWAVYNSLNEKSLYGFSDEEFI